MQFFALSNYRRLAMWYKKGEGVVPDYDGPILVHFDNGSIETIHAQDFIAGHCEYNCKITHWMLVPSPPTSESSGGAKNSTQQANAKM
jgi:hypothetical protein